MLLRAPAPRDQEEFTDLALRSREHLQPWVYLAEDRLSFTNYLRRANQPACCLSLVCRVDDGAIVGGCNLGEIVRGNLQSAYLGYWCFAPYAGQGYLTEAVRLVQDHAFGALRLHRIEANIQPDNAASIALARRCGFTLEGFSPGYLYIGGAWRDHERWAVTFEAWSRRHAR